VGGVEVVGQKDNVLNGGDPKGGGTYLQVEIPTTVVAPTLSIEIPMAAVVASSPDPSMDASSLDPKAARILPEVVAAM
jgi:hypothetical protein